MKNLKQFNVTELQTKDLMHIEGGNDFLDFLSDAINTVREALEIAKNFSPTL
ncbi:hypothetical protein [Aquimarina pacifica]|uniref:hypothetical protein n=1 Tax=Aquimarina pacifica TaxID=1296415 RepID=UPI0004B3AF0C|nr:hypothetical protein [Aquimarina pacifica]